HEAQLDDLIAEVLPTEVGQVKDLALPVQVAAGRMHDSFGPCVAASDRDTDFRRGTTVKRITVVELKFGRFGTSQIDAATQAQDAGGIGGIVAGSPGSRRAEKDFVRERP